MNLKPKVLCLENSENENDDRINSKVCDLQMHLWLEGPDQVDVIKTVDQLWQVSPLLSQIRLIEFSVCSFTYFSLNVLAIQIFLTACTCW